MLRHDAARATSGTSHRQAPVGRSLQNTSGKRPTATAPSRMLLPAEPTHHGNAEPRDLAHPASPKPSASAASAWHRPGPLTHGTCAQPPSASRRAAERDLAPMPSQQSPQEHAAPANRDSDPAPAHRSPARQTQRSGMQRTQQKKRLEVASSKHSKEGRNLVPTDHARADSLQTGHCHVCSRQNFCNVTRMPTYHASSQPEASIGHGHPATQDCLMLHKRPNYDYLHCRAKQLHRLATDCSNLRSWHTAPPIRATTVAPRHRPTT